MSRLRVTLALAALVCSLAAFGEVRLKSSPIVSCDECWNKWADFNGDGLDDLLVRNKLYLNLGGRLAAPFALDAVSEADAVNHLADFNRDGYADLMLFKPAMVYDSVYDRRDEDGPMRLLIGDGKGGFTEKPMPKGAGRVEQIHDYTGDGILDLLRWDFLGQDLSILRGNGDATFTLHQQLPWPHEQLIRELVPADINGDGRLDIVAPYESSLHIFFAQADGTFGNVQTRFVRLELFQPHFADLNGDGKADLVFNDNYRTGAGITALFGDGTGRFPQASRYAVSAPVEANTGIEHAWATDIAVGDFIAGGATEVAFGQMGDGYVSILGVANNQLVELARLDVPARVPRVLLARFRSSRPELVVFGQVHVPGTPVSYQTWLIESEGTVEPATAASAPRRRGRVIGRNAAFTGGRYHVAFEGDCPITAVRNLTLEREGMFIDVGLGGGIERAEAVYLDDELFLRLYIKDGDTTRVVEGTPAFTALGLGGKLYEWKDAPCSRSWQVHRFTATLSH